MYYNLFLLLTSSVFPIVTSIVDIYIHNEKYSNLNIWYKWFLFWSIGIRLLLIGIKKVLFPLFYIKKVYKSYCNQPNIIKDFGFSYISIGILGIISLFYDNWKFPTYITGSILYLLIGLNYFKEEYHKFNISNFYNLINIFFPIIILSIIIYLK